MKLQEKKEFLMELRGKTRSLITRAAQSPAPVYLIEEDDE